MKLKFYLTIVFIFFFLNQGWAQPINLKLYKTLNQNFGNNYKLKFPRDHKSHRDFKTEWWYVTANLRNNDNEFFGIQWTLFRRKSNDNYSKLIDKSNKNPWLSNQFWMAHAVITSKNNHFFSEKFSRGDTGQSGVEVSPFLAWIDNWEFSANDDWSKASIKASDNKFSYDLSLESNGPIIFHGKDGKSIKTREGHYSLYYSQPFFKVNGKIEINNESFNVHGNAWADREWSNAILSSNQDGWDWLSLHLDDETKLMIFRVRDNKNGDFYSGTYIFDKIKKVNLNDNDIEMVPFSYQTKEDDLKNRNWKVPTSWKIIIKKHNIELKVTALNKNSFVDTSIPYWEGPVFIEGTHKGFGYLEMTGY